MFGSLSLDGVACIAARCYWWYIVLCVALVLCGYFSVLSVLVLCMRTRTASTLVGGVGIEAPCASLCIVPRIDIGSRRSLLSSLV